MEFYNISPAKLPEPYRSRFTSNFSRDELKAHLTEELKSNPTCQKFLQDYEESTHESFLRDYAATKADIMLDYAEMEIKSEFGDRTFKAYAEERIWDIQQKKMFDLQCQWRAEKVKLPGVESTKDFIYWENDIKICPWIPPITTADIELYADFLNSNNEDLTSFHVHESWQDYEEFKQYEQNSDDGCALPEWYEFHNIRTGNMALMQLPDIRGEKEEYYRRVWFDKTYGSDYDERQSKRKPLLFFSDDADRMKLIHKLESKRFIKQLGRYFELQNNEDTEDYLEECFRFLLNVGQGFPMLAHNDWREAIIETKNRYVNQQIAANLPLVFEEYQMRMELNIAHQLTNSKDHYDFVQSLKEPVLNGRKLNDEPADFNF